MVSFQVSASDQRESMMCGVHKRRVVHVSGSRTTCERRVNDHDKGWCGAR